MSRFSRFRGWLCLCICLVALAMCAVLATHDRRAFADDGVPPPPSDPLPPPPSDPPPPGDPPPVAVAPTWSPNPPPILDPGSIIIGRGGHELPPNMTLLLVEGETVNLFAHSKDPDTLSDGTTTKYPLDEAQVIWTATGGGTFDPKRTDTGKASKFTPPTIPDGMDSISVTVSATPDDDSTEDPGGPLDGHAGKRNDAPGLAVTITVKIIKSGPTTIKIVRQIALTQYGEFWAKNYPGIKTLELPTYLQIVGAGYATREVK